jgi:hypothetical protein
MRLNPRKGNKNKAAQQAAAPQPPPAATAPSTVTAGTPLVKVRIPCVCKIPYSVDARLRHFHVMSRAPRLLGHRETPGRRSLRVGRHSIWWSSSSWDFASREEIAVKFRLVTPLGPFLRRCQVQFVTFDNASLHLWSAASHAVWRRMGCHCFRYSRRSRGRR